MLAAAMVIRLESGTPITTSILFDGGLFLFRGGDRPREGWPNMQVKAFYIEFTCLSLNINIIPNNSKFLYPVHHSSTVATNNYFSVAVEYR